MKLSDLTGKRFGLLVAQWPAGRGTTGDGITTRRFPPIWWLCLCDCGNMTVVTSSSLKGGTTKSCGCLRKTFRLKHGHARGSGISTPTYRSWQAMIQRCTNPNDSAYRYYGGRGIQVCKRWMGTKGFEHFIADMGLRPSKKTLDRFPDKDGNYKLSNCRWATRKQQQNNLRPMSEEAHSNLRAAWVERRKRAAAGT